MQLGSIFRGGGGVWLRACWFRAVVVIQRGGWQDDDVEACSEANVGGRAPRPRDVRPMSSDGGKLCMMKEGCA